MSAEHEPVTSAMLVARALARRQEGDARVRAIAAELRLDDRDRLDEEARGLARSRWTQWYVAVAERLDVRGTGERLAGIAAELLAEDDELAREIVDAARLEVLERRVAPATAGGASLLVRLTDAADEPQTSAARLLLRRRSARRHGVADPLPPVLHSRAVLRLAALLTDAPLSPASAHAVSQAAIPEGEPALFAALVVVAALDVPTAPGTLLREALGDGQGELAVAILARALEVPAREARRLLIDPNPAELCIALRALGLDDEIAAIAFILPGADDERVACITAARTMAPDQAWASLAPLRQLPSGAVDAGAFV